MNLSLPAVVMFVVGVVLMYSGVKNKYPMDVIREAMRKPAKQGPLATPSVSGMGKAPAPAPPSGAQPAINPPGTVWTSV